jgi:hypothetical protein
MQRRPCQCRQCARRARRLLRAAGADGLSDAQLEAELDAASAACAAAAAAGDGAPAAAPAPASPRAGSPGAPQPPRPPAIPPTPAAGSRRGPDAAAAALAPALLRLLRARGLARRVPAYAGWVTVATEHAGCYLVDTPTPEPACVAARVAAAPARTTPPLRCGCSRERLRTGAERRRALRRQRRARRGPPRGRQAARARRSAAASQARPAVRRRGLWRAPPKGRRPPPARLWLNLAAPPLLRRPARPPGAPRMRRRLRPSARRAWRPGRGPAGGTRSVALLVPSARWPRSRRSCPRRLPRVGARRRARQSRPSRGRAAAGSARCWCPGATTGEPLSRTCGARWSSARCPWSYATQARAPTPLAASPPALTRHAHLALIGRAPLPVRPGCASYVLTVQPLLRERW